MSKRKNEEPEQTAAAETRAAEVAPLTVPPRETHELTPTTGLYIQTDDGPVLVKDEAKEQSAE